MEYVGIVVDDLAAATAFFVELGLKLQGEGPVEGGWVDRVVGLEGVRAKIAMMETPARIRTAGTQRARQAATASRTSPRTAPKSLVMPIRLTPRP
jgi:catechol 2,3-dioxygenase-like lactoylglutathione lyase family enzyme